jgi:hypothetical protein
MAVASVAASLLVCPRILSRAPNKRGQNAMPETLDPLILDLVEWVARQPRAYADVMEAWRTSCPRLTVWEDAVDRGFVARERTQGSAINVVVTPAGRRFLADHARGVARGAPEAATSHLSKAASIGTR